MGKTVTLQDNNKSFTVGDGETLLEAALYQDVALPYGCQSGGCGACRARVIQGEIHYDYEPPALSPQEKADGYILLCQARANSDLVIQVEELPDHHAIQVKNIPVRVEQKRQLSHDVMALWLKLPKGEIFEYLAGQYVDILLRDGRRRSFSIANAPEDFRATGLLELHLRHVPDGHFTNHVFQDMPDRAMMRIEGPLGGFYLREDSTRPLILMGGGTGFAPLKAICEHIQARQLERSVHLYWGVRTEADLYLDSVVQAWQQNQPGFSYTPVLSEAENSEASTVWQGRTGWVHEAIQQDYQDLRDLDVYMSGPPPMIEAARAGFSAHGLPTDQLYYDAFDYAFETWPDRESTQAS